jgi:hypothetical protein
LGNGNTVDPRVVWGNYCFITFHIFGGICFYHSHFDLCMKEPNTIAGNLIQHYSYIHRNNLCCVAGQIKGDSVQIFGLLYT